MSLFEGRYWEPRFIESPETAAKRSRYETVDTLTLRNACQLANIPPYTAAKMESLPHDFVSLPIIITDWDAVNKAKSEIHIPTAEIERSHTAAKPTSSDPGLTESFEAIWNRISDAMKIKVREAANEVLRRTDVMSSTQQEMSFQYDNDARFLD